MFTSSILQIQSNRGDVKQLLAHILYDIPF